MAPAQGGIATGDRYAHGMEAQAEPRHAIRVTLGLVGKGVHENESAVGGTCDFRDAIVPVPAGRRLLDTCQLDVAGIVTDSLGVGPARPLPLLPPPPPHTAAAAMRSLCETTSKVLHTPTSATNRCSSRRLTNTKKKKRAPLKSTAAIDMRFQR